jgi:NTP pyrophosphohydrolases including oxidative damage repair enzymes
MSVAHQTNSLDPAPAKVRPASSVLVWRTYRGGLEVLCGVRNPGMAFAAGQIVFPGGRLEAGDARRKSLTPLSDDTRKWLSHESRHKPEGLAHAGLRELWEETGYVAGTLHKWGLNGDYGPLQFLLRAITPPGQVRRFDARFFAFPHDAVREKVAPADSHEELLDLKFRPLDDLFASKLMPPTRIALQQLRDMHQGMFQARMMRGRDNVFLMPDPSDHEA